MTAARARIRVVIDAVHVRIAQELVIVDAITVALAAPAAERRGSLIHLIHLKTGRLVVERVGVD